jgi:GNAT superfamily N-acetyltransferase
VVTLSYGREKMMADRSPTTYRKATVDDIDILTRFRLMFLAKMRSEPSEPTHLTEVIRSYFDRTIPSGEFLAYLAIRSGLVVGVGGMAVYELPPLCAPRLRKKGCVLNMYTMPAARRTGVAGQILDLLIAEARNLGLSHIHLRATDEGIGLYRQAGFSEPRFLEMELALEPATHG